jgi:ATP-dependent DNA helicase RecG
MMGDALETGREGWVVMSEEMQIVEWKKNWRDEWLKWICGYANAQGGLLEIGKDDNGDVVGLENAKKLLEDIPNKIKNSMGILADVDLERENDKPFISIKVLPYYSPISYHGKYYYRTGSTMHELTGRSLDEFMLKKMGRTWDSILVPNVTVEDLDSAAFREFRRKAIASGRLKEDDLNISNEELLNNLGLIENGQLRMATVLLFHALPSKFVTGAFIKIGYFESDGELLYQDEIQSSLVTITDKVMDILFLKYFKGIIHYEGIQRVDQYPVDWGSMREAILNSVIHNLWQAYNPIQIKVFPDRVYVFNSGELPESWSVETLFKTHNSIQRNPNIAMTIFRTGMIEAWGSGIDKIVAGCRSIDAPDPVFESLGNTTSIMLMAPQDAIYRPKADKSAVSVDRPLISADRPLISADRKLNERAQLVLNFIDNYGSIANSDARKLFGLKDNAVRNIFNQMMQKGLIEAVGIRKYRTYRRPTITNTDSVNSSAAEAPASTDAVEQSKG